MFYKEIRQFPYQFVRPDLNRIASVAQAANYKFLSVLSGFLKPLGFLR